MATLVHSRAHATPFATPLARPLARLLAAAAFLSAGILHAQSAAPPDSATVGPVARTGRPRVGVVLSGGSAKALAHIGVLRVLEEVGVPVDVVTGTSMGAMVGGVYAIGYSASVLEQVVTTLDWGAYFQDAPQRRFLGVDRRLLGTRTLVSFPITRGRLGLPSGVIGGQRVSELLARLTWPAQTERDFRRLPTPFAAVATDLATRDAVVLDSGSLAETLRASMSLPTVFKPVELGGRLLADGAIARNLPAQEARALGADVVICSDVSDSLASPAELRSMVDVLMQTIAFQVYASTVEQRRLCDVYIRPSRAGMSTLAFDQAREWVARGAAAARAALPQLREIARHDGLDGAIRRPRWASLREEPARVRGIVVQGAVGQTERVVRRALRLAPGAWVTPDTLEDAVGRVYATGLFERVTYRLDAAAPDPPAGADSAAARVVDVVVSAAVASQDRLGFGFRFDNRYKASLLFAADLRNRAGFGSTTQLEVRLGEQLRLGAQYLRAGVVDSRLALGATAAFTRTPLDIFAGGQRVDEVSVEVTDVSALVGTVLGTNGLAGVQLKGAHSSAVSTITPLDTSASSSQTFYSVAAIFRRESFDRAMFPRRGTAVYAKAEWAGGEAKFSHHVLDARSIVPISPTVSLVGRVTVGAALGGGQVPLQYRFFLGGVNTSAVFPETQISFAGFRPQELSGAAVERVGAAMQWEVRRDWFTTLRMDAGTAGDRLRFAPGGYRVRGAVSVGAATPFGPIELTGSGRSISDLPRLELNIGVAF